MNEIQKFTNEEFGEIRTVTIDGEPWFIATDICKILGITNTTDALNKGLEDFEKTRFNLGLRGGKTNVVNESGFYTLVLRSRKEISKPFRLWVTGVVLPQIRKTGGYIPINEKDDDNLVMAKALKIADATIKRKDEIIAQKNRLIEEQQPMVENYKLLMDTKGTFSINEVAHFVGIGEYYLFKYLRELGILFYNDNNDNVPYENPVNKNKFRVVPAIAPDGSAHSVTRVLPCGIDYICKQLKKHGYVEVA